MSAAATLDEIALPRGTRVIADLHLDPSASGPWNAFRAWLARTTEMPALIVLGDLFEYWTGAGQAREPVFAELLGEMHRRAQAGTALHFLHGNRDFLLGRAFERAVAGCVHPTGLVGSTPRGERVLFLHGDELATRDHAYQRLRRVLRSGPVRALSGATPAVLSAAVARALRRRSRRAVAVKSTAEMELQSAAAAEWCARTRADRIVCGHAHRWRSEELPGGARWIVLDAFGGARDVLCVAASGELEAERSSGCLRGDSPSLSSPVNMMRVNMMSVHMIVALDGPAGVGKSSVASLVAHELGFFFLDTGAMYRAVTLEVLGHGVDPSDEAACGRIARALELDFDAAGKVLVGGRSAEPAIRGTEVTRAVSLVSAHRSVREAVVARQRALAAAKEGVVAEGRDTTTVVFPDADHKFYLTASAAERALRRARQENALDRIDEIRADIERRDALDSSRAHAPLREAPDATRIETDGRSLEEVVALVLGHVRGARR